MGQKQSRNHPDFDTWMTPGPFCGKSLRTTDTFFSILPAF
jgi:hypothetical protein